MEPFTLIEAIFFTSIVVSLLMIGYPLLLRFLQYQGMLRDNYRGQQILVSVGILIPLLHVAIWPFIGKEEFHQLFFLQSTALLAVGYVGWKDDQVGGAEAKGLKGHVLYALRQRKISTGLWKAIIVGAVAFLLSAEYSNSVPSFFLHFLLISLLANLINLLDLRPGRAIKGFFIIFLPFICIAFGKIPYPLWLTVVIPVIFLFSQDVKGKIMLGDAGSNGLGLVIGFWVMLYAPVSFKIFLVLLSVWLHLYAEKKSITLFIQRTQFLNWLDMLGR